MKNIYLVRHCQAEGQAAEAPLSDLGIMQASKLADYLLSKNIDCILSSPYERARKSILPLAQKLGIEIALDDRLSERVLSEKSLSNWRELLRETFEDLDLSYAGGETSRTAMNRGISVVKEVTESKFHNIVLVSHGNLISLILKYFDERIGFEEWEALSNPDVFHLSYESGTPKIKRIWDR